MDQWHTEDLLAQRPGRMCGTHRSPQGTVQHRSRLGGGCKAAFNRGANFYTYFLFHFGFVRACGTAQDRSPDTDFPQPWGSYLPTRWPLPAALRTSSRVTKSSSQEWEAIGQYNNDNNHKKRLREGIALTAPA